MTSSRPMLRLGLVLSILMTGTPKKFVRRRRLGDQFDLNLIANVGHDFDRNNTVPLMFHIPKAGGTGIKHLVATCLRLVVADQEGIAFGHDQDEQLSIVSERKDGAVFVNVDVSRKEGLQRAKDLGFAASELAEVVFSPLLRDGISALYDEEHKASIFAIFRHPIERELSLFYYLQVADWEEYYSPEWKNWTVMQYIESGHVEDNWLVRSISGNWQDEISRNDVEFCKIVVTNKMWIGLITEFGESIRRLGALYGWDQRPEWHGCVDEATNHKQNSHKHPALSVESEEFKILREKLKYDMEVYRHVVEMFHEQSRFFLEEDSQ